MDGFELSPELLRAIAPDVNPDKAQVKFDAKGTLHVLQRGDSGQLVKDYALKHVEESIKEDTGPSRSDRLSELRNRNKAWRRLFRVTLLSIGSLILPCLYIVHKDFMINVGDFVTLIIWLICVLFIAIYGLIWLIRNKWFVT